MAPLRAGQTTAPLAGLGISRDRPRQLEPGENLDVVVEHVLQELDWHYLAVRPLFFSYHASGGGVGEETASAPSSFPLPSYIHTHTDQARVPGRPPRHRSRRRRGWGPTAHDEAVQVQGVQPRGHHDDAPAGHGGRLRVAASPHGGGGGWALEGPAGRVHVPPAGALTRSFPFRYAASIPTLQVLIQAHVKNITERHTALMLEDVAFVAEDGLVAEPLPNYDVTEPATRAQHPVSPSRVLRLTQPHGAAAGGADAAAEDDDDDDDDSCDCVRAFDRHVYLQPDDVVQFLYRLRRAGSYKGCTMVLAPGMPLGCVRMVSCFDEPIAASHGETRSRGVSHVRCTHIHE